MDAASIVDAANEPSLAQASERPPSDAHGVHEGGRGEFPVAGFREGANGQSFVRSSACSFWLLTLEGGSGGFEV
jgi:hypothetical protein